MPIRDQIEAVVGQLVIQPSFIFGTANEFNLALDDMAFPVIMLYTLKPGQDAATLSNSVNENFSIYMEFLYKTEFDQFSSQNETFIEQANNLKNEFLVKLQNYREQPPNGARYFKVHRADKRASVPVYNKFNVNCTGVNLTLMLNTMNNAGYDPNSRPA